MVSRALRVLRTQRIWRRPQRIRVLIYGWSGSEILGNYIAEPVHIYRHPEDVLVVPVAFHALLRGRFTREGYLRSYVQTVQPMVVLTNEDNDPLFYRIKCLFPAIVTIAVQNGRRDNFATTPRGGFFQQLKSQRESVGASASHIALFGSGIKSLYTSALGQSQSVKYTVTGSLRNNAIAPTTGASRRRLVYISSMPSMIGDQHPESDRVLCYYHGSSVAYSDFWRVEKELIARTASYAIANQLPLLVLGKRSPTIKEEYEFFKQELSGLDFEFLPAESQASSYLHASPNDVFVASDSTLAYELLGRGYRVAFVAARLQTLGIRDVRDFHFGFPLNLPDHGPFWTTTTNTEEVERVMEFAVTSAQVEWDNVSRSIREDVMAYDPQNRLFCELLSSAGVVVDGPKWWDTQRIPKN